MRLFEALKIVTIDNEELIEDIRLALEDRKDTVECQEPDPDKEFFYEQWEEKYEDICDIVDSIEYLQEEENLEERQKMLDKIINDIEIHQISYSGLKRLII